MGGLGASWGVFGGCGAILKGFSRDIGVKMGHVGAQMAMLGSFWEALGGSLEHFWSNLADALDIKKH